MAYVNLLTATGSTNSSTAMSTAYNALVNNTSGSDENSIQQAKNGVEKPSKYIVFMTDGKNTLPKYAR